MTDATNGWPGEPGVPLNPERDGWHWFKTPDGLEVSYEWRAAGGCEDFCHWPDYWVPVHDDNWQAMQCTYLGPCLTLDQTTALQARVAELECLVAYLCGRNTDHVQVALVGNPIVADAVIKRAEAALERKKE